ncbi:MAG: hypothetical protein IJD67_04880 [Clostridia bacterium]|nr:hypothetical protein [Clostridia bacterium]
MLKEINKIISRTCVCFTACELILLIIAQAMISDGEKSDMLVSFLGLAPALLILLSALVFNLLSYVLKIKILPGAVKRLLHYILSMLCVVIVCVIIPQRAEARFLLVLLSLATILYFVIWLVTFILGKIFKSKEEIDGEYTSVFDERKD